MPSDLMLPFASTADSTALFSFVVYLLLVFGLAVLSGFVRSESGFVSEYFLGGRNLGVWAFALTFAATSASGGSFVGFPALIYTHGWVLALWIAGYMVVPLVAMGLLGKRLNQFARTADAITIPDVIERRFGSACAGVIATLLIVVFLFYFLLAQFKAGSKILVTLLSGVPAFDEAVAWFASATAGWKFFAGTEPDYVLCLGVFSAAVIVYVVYGGFRAVVWTDVMQGIIMFFGVVVLLVLTMRYVGGIENATRRLNEMTPPRYWQATVTPSERQELGRQSSPSATESNTARTDPTRGAESGPSNETTEPTLATDSPTLVLPRGTWLYDDEGRLVRAIDRIQWTGDSVETTELRVLELTTPADIETIDPSLVDRGFRVTLVQREPYGFGADQPGVYIRPPGPQADAKQPGGFLPVTLAFSFFLFWPFGGAGQPSNMVRLMAFKDTRTLKLSLVTVTIYFSFIYFALVVIFCGARVLMPGMEADADRVMPQLAIETTQRAGLPWMAGMLLAAPFAAVMSSVDSFLLMVSSSVVRDVYQRYIHPQAEEKLLKRVTYIGTVSVGLLATYGALRPPEYLQQIIVDASGFLAGSFCVPVAFSLYWRRMNAAGVIAGMLAGMLTHAYFSFQVYQGIPWLESFHASFHVGPLFWDLIVSAIAVIVVTRLTPAPAESLVERYFGVARETPSP